MDLCKNIDDFLNTSEENHNLEWKLFYLKEFLAKIYDIIEDTQTISFEPAQPIKKDNNILIFPLIYQDEIIYVPEGSSIKDMFDKGKNTSD